MDFFRPSLRAQGRGVEFWMEIFLRGDLRATLSRGGCPQGRVAIKLFAASRPFAGAGCREALRQNFLRHRCLSRGLAAGKRCDKTFCCIAAFREGWLQGRVAIKLFAASLPFAGGSKN